MDLKTLLASAPMIRRAWRVVPGPLKLPLIVVALIVWLVRRRGDDAAADVPGGAARDTAGATRHDPGR